MLAIPICPSSKSLWTGSPTLLVSISLWVLAMAMAVLSCLGGTPASHTRARELFQAARRHYSEAGGDVAACWQLGRSAFDLAELAESGTERAETAKIGVEACRKAIQLDASSAPAHYYLALNLAQLARTKLLGALRLLHEIEHELLAAASLDQSFDYAGPDRVLGVLYLEAPTFPTGIGNRGKAQSHLERAVELSPRYPENYLCLGEAYAKWGEPRNLDRQIKALQALLPSARSEFSGSDWAADRKNWEQRLQKLEASREKLLANPRGTATDRGARRQP